MSEDEESIEEPTNPDEPQTVELKYPIALGKDKPPIESLTLRPMTGRDMRRLKSSVDQPLALTLELAGYLSGQTTQVIDKLRGSDLTKVLEVTSSFFEGTPKIGVGS